MAGAVDPLLYSTRKDMGLDTLWLNSAICKEIDSYQLCETDEKNSCTLGLCNTV